ncbi:hypothetical protein BFJ72_g5392 [Fusarium proliferatum]|uniref:Uncharacterized protein n=1 Tax=Gibberella intermedia TaxID=948311 RepID=A0A420TIX9_GIBIN|nr:hypothetical protein BFJ72_g5392 [Fusarium proliferatum]
MSDAAKMSDSTKDSEATKSMTVHFKLKKGKNEPKKILLEELQEHYGTEQVQCLHEVESKSLAIIVKKNCDTAEIMKEELRSKLKETDVFKTWEEDRIIVVHVDNHCSYLLGDPYPKQ